MYVYTGNNHDVNHMSYLINLELSKISDWLAVNKLSLNVDKTKFMIFHNHHKVIPTHDIPCLVINNTVVERVTEFNFLGLTINEFMNWSSHSSKIANKISRTLGIMNRLNSSWPHAFARIMARERRAAHGPNSRDCWSPGEPARVQPPFPQDIWTLSCSVIRLALIGAGVLVRIWSISNN